MTSRSMMLLLATLLLAGGLLGTAVLAATVEYDLTIARQAVHITGHEAEAMTLNGSIPGPTLRFTEGDLARIRVHNAMAVDTSIHWHGVLVPPTMDGVPYVSYPPIAPRATFTYEFPIRQSGTYWYHSHTRLQEQSGVYGAIVIAPRKPVAPPIRADRDEVILFSDWTDEKPHQVLRTLKRGSDWYAIEKGSAQSILGAARRGELGAYFQRELLRMPPMDLADVAYDRFLANGRPELSLPASSGETVQLRIVDGSASSFFHLQFAGGPLTIIAADGQPVEPDREGRLLIGVAETYDLLVTLPGPGTYELRATAHDGSGYASVWIGSGDRHPAPAIPRPDLYATKMGKPTLSRIFALRPQGSMGMTDAAVAAGRFDRPGMMGMGSMNMGNMQDMGGMPGMEHGMGMSEIPGIPGTKASPSAPRAGMAMGAGDTSREGMAPASLPASLPPRGGKQYGRDFRFLGPDVARAGPVAVDGIDPARPWSPYSRLRSIESTALPTDRPVREVRLTLDGDMERYVWFINNRPLSESDDIRIRAGEVVRFIMINRTMMHHPMHLHGHFFRVINGQGDYSPLKHTVDVAPMSTTVIEFEASEVGDWFFHCHLLYHLKSGMARVVHYESYTLNPQLAAVRPRLYRESWYAWGEASLLSNMSEGYVTAADTRNNLTAEWEMGWQHVPQSEWEGIVTWDRYLNRFLTIFAGGDFGDAIEKNRGIAGLRYLLPFNLETRAFAGSDGEARVEVGRGFQLTPRLALDGRVQFDTDTLWEYRTGLSYTVTRALSLRAGWHSDYRWGGGLQVRF
jgi:CopA family copper-resistance protein